MSHTFDLLRKQKLQWLPELGIGYFPVVDEPYDHGYWMNYRQLDMTHIGVVLTDTRIDLVHSYWKDRLVDVGIGGGTFVKTRPLTYGYDINNHAVEWLRQQGTWFDPSQNEIGAASFWDSLEHIHNPDDILKNIKHYVFTSMPIYKNVDHILRSKHFKPSEHCWYFTIAGITNFMAAHGFELLHYDDREQAAGREDILSFVFRRV